MNSSKENILKAAFVLRGMQLDTTIHGEAREALKEMSDLLMEEAKRAQQAHDAQRWIPVSKRLPKPYESVLASWMGGGLEIMFIETKLDGSDPRWNKTFSSDPSHWMPLPAAPAGEQA